MPAWEPDFDFYEGTMEEDRAMVMIDLAAAPHAPLASHPVRLQLRVKMLRPRDDGLRSQEEADALFALEDRLLPAMGKAAQAIYVGRVVAQGYTEFIFYVPADRVEAANDPAAAVGEVAPYGLEWFTEDDAAWEKYDQLFPNTYALQTIMNRRLVAQMQEAGDQLQVAREVDHLVNFPSKQAAETAAAALAQAGFRIDPMEAPEADDPWALQFHRDDACDGDKPDTFVFEILDIVEPLEGDYDGWGSLLQRQ